METLRSQLLHLSKVSPQLRYSTKLAKQLSHAREPTLEVIKAYFAQQPEVYLGELEEIEKINGVSLPEERRALIFVPAFNEERNLASLVDQYTSQMMDDNPINPKLYEVCFVINYPEHSYMEKNAANVTRFEDAVDLLIEKKKEHPNIHILPKIFKSDEGSLGRSRKYGMDYCLWRLLKYKPNEIDKYMIISNEGDTLAMPKDYIVRFIKLFAAGTPRFVQGKIDYPRELIDICEPLKIFTGIREAVHFGQGLAGDAFPYFDGIMPIGRNFAASPRLCAQVGGIDPIRRKDTDDDMNFGTDIHVLLGEHFKSVCSIPLVTNPRRELTIVRDIIAGRKLDSKKSYEHFHENRALYDLTYTDILMMATNEIPFRVPNRTILSKLANQYFQWVLISRYKAELSDSEGFAEIIKQHRDHFISYWEKERWVCAVFERHLSKLKPSERQRIEECLVTEAITWFNKFVSPFGVQYECTKDGLKSVLQ